MAGSASHQAYAPFVLLRRMRCGLLHVSLAGVGDELSYWPRPAGPAAAQAPGSWPETPNRPSTIIFFLSALSPSRPHGMDEAEQHLDRSCSRAPLLPRLALPPREMRVDPMPHASVDSVLMPHRRCPARGPCSAGMCFEPWWRHASTPTGCIHPPGRWWLCGARG